MKRTKFIVKYNLLKYLFDDDHIVKQASEIAQAILDACSLRLTDIAAQMSGSMDAAYKRIQRFLRKADPREALWRLFREDAEFVIGDITEIERPQAKNTSYVGILKDGKTRGFQVFILATPFRGRAIPFDFVTYSSRTIAEEGTSRNMNHYRAFAHVKDLIGECPLVLDREFSYEKLLEDLEHEGIRYVIRLKMGSHPPKFYNEDGREIRPVIRKGERIVYRGVLYKGKVEVNLIGYWGRGLNEPLWIMTNLEPDEGLRIYTERMKIEESFRDLKSLLGMGRLMNKRRDYMEKMIALLLIVYTIGLLVGESLRDFLYAKPVALGEDVPDDERVPGSRGLKKRGNGGNIQGYLCC